MAAGETQDGFSFSRLIGGRKPVVSEPESDDSGEAVESSAEEGVDDIEADEAGAESEEGGDPDASAEAGAGGDLADADTGDDDDTDEERDSWRKTLPKWAESLPEEAQHRIARNEAERRKAQSRHDQSEADNRKAIEEIRRLEGRLQAMENGGGGNGNGAAQSSDGLLDGLEDDDFPTAGQIRQSEQQKRQTEEQRQRDEQIQTALRRIDERVQAAPDKDEAISFLRENQSSYADDLPLLNNYGQLMLARAEMREARNKELEKENKRLRAQVNKAGGGETTSQGGRRRGASGEPVPGSGARRDSGSSEAQKVRSFAEILETRRKARGGGNDGGARR